LEPKEILRIGFQVATGLGAAHVQGLIHRDIKPANILLENGVERVKITDFGLARAADDASLSQSGVVAGTPQYMAPEQAEGKSVDQRADLFSLGSVLYALCTGRPPFRASTSMAVLKRVCEDTPQPIRELNPGVPDGLVGIITRLQTKDPAERFQSAAQVAELLSQHLANLQQPALPPVSVLKPRGLRRLRLSLDKHPRWRLTVAAVLLVVGGLGLTEATGITRLAATVIGVLNPDGTLVVEVDHPRVQVTIEGDDGMVVTGTGRQEIRLKAGSYQVLVAKDGKTIKEELVSISRGGRRGVWDIAKVPNFTEARWQASRSDEQLTRTIMEGQGACRPPAPGTLTLEEAWALTRFIRTFVPKTEASPPDGSKPKKLTEIRRWDIPGETVEQPGRHTATVRCVAYSPEGKLPASGGEDSLVIIHDAEPMRERARLQHTNWVWGMAFSPDSRQLVTAQGDGRMRLWDVKTASELPVFRGHAGSFISVAFSLDGRRILSGGMDSDRTMRLWDAQTGEELRCFTGHGRIVWSVAFSPDGCRALSSSADRIVRHWDLETGELLGRLEGHTGSVRSVVFCLTAAGHCPAAVGRQRKGTGWTAPCVCGTSRRIRSFSASNAIAIRCGPQCSCPMAAVPFQLEAPLPGCEMSRTAKNCAASRATWRASIAWLCPPTGAMWSRPATTEQCAYGIWRPARNGPTVERGNRNDGNQREEERKQIGR
jgi:hypothetical protein